MYEMLNSFMRGGWWILSQVDQDFFISFEAVLCVEMKQNGSMLIHFLYEMFNRKKVG